MKKIFFMILTVLALASCGKETGKDSDWVARIEGNETITYGEFRHFLDMTVKMNMSQGEAAVRKQDVEFQKAMLDNLISQRIVLKEVEKSNLIKPEFIEVFQLQALSKYFIYKNIAPKVDLPTDQWLASKFEDPKIKAELAKRGITTLEQARSVIASEYQRIKYFQVLSDEMKKLKYEYRKKLNDEFEQDAIKKYVLNQLPQADYGKTWLFKIEDKETTAAEMDRFVNAMVQVNYGEDGLKRYESDSSFKSNVRQQIFEDFFGAILVMNDAKTKGWLNDEETKSFVKLYIDSEKTKYFMKAQIAASVEKPTDAEIQAYYKQHQGEIKKPFQDVKGYLEYRLFSEKAEVRAAKYIERIKNEKKIEINDSFFVAKENKKEEDKK